MIETFNYNLVENKEVTLEDILNLKNVKVSDANSKIKREIKEIQEKNDSLTELGYNMYKRDVNSDMYEVPNIEQYYYDVKRRDKLEVLSILLDIHNPKLSLVFCNTKKMVDEVTAALQ